MRLRLLLLTALSLSSVQGRDLTSDLPSPWLTVDRGAKVLHLQCKPPPGVSHFCAAVHDLRITAFVPHRSMRSNISLVTMTSNMAAPKVNDLMFPIHSVSFQGDWGTTDVSLDFAFPVTDQDLGRYFCTVFYTDTDHQHSKLASEIVVDQNFVYNHLGNQPKIVDGFSAEIVDTHQVHVTWKKPRSGKFTKATVSRRFVDNEGHGAEPSTSLYTSNGLRHFQYTSAVVLSRFNAHDRDNMSVVLYVQSGDHNPHSLSYRYSCRVPCPACQGGHELSCTCCQRAGSPDTEICPTSSEDSQALSASHHIFFALFLVCFIVICVLLTVFGTFKAGRCRDDSRFQKIFTPKRQSVEEDDDISSDRAPLQNTEHGKSCQDSRRAAQRDRTGVQRENHSGLSAQPQDSASSNNSNESKNNDQTLSASKPEKLSSPPRSKSKERKGLDQPGIVSLPLKNSSPNSDHEDFTDLRGAEGGSVPEAPVKGEPSALAMRTPSHSPRGDHAILHSDTGLRGAEGGSVPEAPVEGDPSALATRNLSHSPRGDHAFLRSDDIDSIEPQNAGRGGEETRALIEQERRERENDIALNRPRRHWSEPVSHVSKQLEK